MNRAIRRRRPHPAASARVLATGLSFSAMFGLTAAMTAQSAAEAQEAALQQVELSTKATVTPPAPPPATVVIVRRYVVAPSQQSPGRPSTGSVEKGSAAAASPSVKAAAPAPPKPRPAPAPKPDAVTKGSG